MVKLILNSCIETHVWIFMLILILLDFVALHVIALLCIVRTKIVL